MKHWRLILVIVFVMLVTLSLYMCSRAGYKPSTITESASPEDNIARTSSEKPDFGNRFDVVQDFFPASRGFETVQKETRAFVLLDNHSQGRNRKACEAFGALPTPEIIKNIKGEDVEMVSTYWLLKDDNDGPLPCKDMLNDYDYDRATQLRKAYHLPIDEGPILLAIDSTGAYFYIDMKKASEKTMVGAFQTWNNIAHTHYAAGEGSLTFKDEGFLAKLGAFICGQAGKTADAGVAGILKGPTPLAVGELIIGGTISLFCPKAATADKPAPAP